MSPTARDVALGAALLLAFPAAINLTAATASDRGPSPEDPLWKRGGEPTSTSANR